MRFRFLFISLILLISSMPPLPAAADTRYVGDELVITLRQGKGTDYKIIRTLKSGTPFEVLEEGKSYLKVRTEDGVEGYVLRQYVTSGRMLISRSCPSYRQNMLKVNRILNRHEAANKQ